MAEQERYIDVLLPLALPRPLTYRVPADWGEVQVGHRVLVPLGKHKFYAAVVKRLHGCRPEGYAVREALQLLDEKPVADARQLAFWEWMASYYLSTEGEVMAAALPSGFKLESEGKVAIHPDFSGEISRLSALEIRLLNLLSEKKCMTLRNIGEELSISNVAMLVRNMLDNNILIRYEEVEERYIPRRETYLSLAEKYRDDEAALSGLFDELEINSRLQRQSDTLLLFLSLSRSLRQPMVPKRSLMASEKASESSLKQLIKKGVLCQEEMEVSRLSSFKPEKAVESIVLTEAQQTAMDEIVRQWGRFQTVLLHGVTGSGKTEIYIRLIQRVLEQGKQVLYLLPEIALTTQIIHRLQCYFGDKVGVYHSRFNEQERVEIWNRVKAEDASAYQVVIGARSALFLPFRQLGLIVIDEEHDSSFKQYDPSPRYHARDAAMVLAQQHQAKVLLGSATPSVESYANTQRGKYGLVTLSQRYSGMDLPEIRPVDLRLPVRSPRGMAPYSEELLSQISDALDAGEQVILFQNRRGFSPHLECGVCHYIPVCRHCDVALTYHKAKHQLRCHYCGYTEKLPHDCPQCKSPNLQMRGFGTEKVEEELAVFFPKARIARLDYDTTRSRTAYQKIIQDFELRNIQVLVGTQMVTKGLDFEHVSTVGILNADNLLHFPDFRAYERAFQVISQVSGRAGRRHRRGVVLIQTYFPEHPLFKWVMDNDYQTMYRHVMAERSQFVYPPFCRFVKITLKHRNATVLDAAALQLAQLLRRRFGPEVLGPAYPSIPRVKNLYMKDIILKIGKNGHLPEAKQLIRQSAEAMLSEPAYRSVFVSYDVDPY